jgi:A/G-specific adenine glycosylase
MPHPSALLAEGRQTARREGTPGPCAWLCFCGLPASPGCTITCKIPAEKITLEHRIVAKSISQPRWRRKLLAWFDQNKRDLPWRKDRDPYRVWLSEIMLQQTRVAAVIEHYHEFLRRFPTVEKLAAAREASVLAAWSGLGYYRRARMMHAAAREIINQYKGRLPRTAAELRELPGIGRYTAAAIASIAWNEPVAVVDGNVERVLQRALGKRMNGEQIWQIAGELLSPSRPGDFNQAMMELGATVCLPRQPKCLLCPLSDMCATRGELGLSAKATRQQKREVYYALHSRNGSIFLVKRPKAASLMPGMWELPEVAGANGTAEFFLTLGHSITVTDYTVRVIQGRSRSETPGHWVAKSRLTDLPLTGLTRKILLAAKII